jgi:hypothetical protein
MLYTFEHGGTLRSFAFTLPPDWFDQVRDIGPVPLLTHEWASTDADVSTFDAIAVMWDFFLEVS